MRLEMAKLSQAGFDCAEIGEIFGMRRERVRCMIHDHPLYVAKCPGVKSGLDLVRRKRELGIK
jgi:hypothetical protein